jgi:DNA-binding protein HU-beta
LFCQVVFELLKTCRIAKKWLISQRIRETVLKTRELIQKLQETAPGTGERTQELLDLTTSIIGKILASGDSLSIQGFGTFETKKKEERVSVNPSTGSRWMIPPKFVPNFKPGTNLKEKIKNFSVNEP